MAMTMNVPAEAMTRGHEWAFDPDYVLMVESENPRFEPHTEAEIVGYAKEFLDPEVGQVQNILVRRVGDNQPKVIMGYGRLKAARMVKHGNPKYGIEPHPDFKIRCSAAKGGVCDREALLKAVVENKSRRENTCMDDAYAMRKLRAEGVDEAAIREKLKLSTEWVRLLDQLLGLPRDIQQVVHRRRLDVRRAVALTKLPSEADMRRFLEEALAEDERADATIFEGASAPVPSVSAPVTQRLANGEAKIDNRKFDTKMRGHNEQAGIKKARSKAEIVAYFQSLVDGPGEDPAVQAFAKRFIEYAADECGDRAMDNAIAAILNARPADEKPSKKK